ncbi:hypothetical protein RIF29_38339 [Crotalaria pallida]|uniref:Uncharacterized protein n=1 Tax=Crotalaria pallida TaxID=3830 RepID=A0AAN9HNP1_CROPI
MVIDFKLTCPSGTANGHLKCSSGPMFQGEVQPQLEVAPITKYTSDHGLALGWQIMVNRTYICYGLKLVAIRGKIPLIGCGGISRFEEEEEEEERCVKKKKR